MSDRSHKSRGIGDPEQHARAVNLEPWEPLPGMVKRQCVQCEFWYAASPRQRTMLCPDCQELERKGLPYRGRHRPRG